jgi:hypothetical protein
VETAAGDGDDALASMDERGVANPALVNAALRDKLQTLGVTKAIVAKELAFVNRLP